MLFVTIMNFFKIKLINVYICDSCQIKPVVHQLVESNISGETMTLDVALSKLIDITGSRKLAEWILQSMRSENIDRKHRENSSSDLTAYELELIVKNVENV